MDHIKSIALQLERRSEQAEIDRVQAMLSKSLHGFRPDPRVDKFSEQFHISKYGVLHRFLSLGLFGGSQIGKSQKGLSLFGISRTLKVSCQDSAKASYLPLLVSTDNSIVASYGTRFDPTRF